MSTDTDQQDQRTGLLIEAYAQRLARAEHDALALSVDLQLARARIAELEQQQEEQHPA